MKRFPVMDASLTNPRIAAIVNNDHLFLSAIEPTTAEIRGKSFVRTKSAGSKLPGGHC